MFGITGAATCPLTTSNAKANTLTTACTSAPAIQWKISTNGGLTFTNITGATSATLTLLASATNNGYFNRAVFTNSQGSATTTAAKLTVR